MLQMRTPTHTHGKRRPHVVGRRCAIALCIAAALALASCGQSRHALRPPQQIIAPYDPAAGEVTWAVLPLRNESGTTAANTLALTDKLIVRADEIEGVTVLPLNRALSAMRQLGIAEPGTPAEVEQIAKALGVDGVLVGSVTAYRPYDPPLYGLGLALYARPERLQGREAGSSEMNVRRLVFQPTDYAYFRTFEHENTPTTSPVSVIGTMLDGTSHAVQEQVRMYADGRSEDVSALGWRSYLASMDRYTEFASWFAVQRLMDHEWIRLAGGASSGGSAWTSAQGR